MLYWTLEGNVISSRDPGCKWSCNNSNSPDTENVVIKGDAGEAEDEK
jgi:hypothetical protein